MTDIVERLPPLKPLPDCMMPDGAQPCVAFSNLEAELERLQFENRAFALKEKSLQDEIKRLRDENKSLAEKTIKALEMWRDAKR
jgi:hypothetical protein